MTRTKSLIMIAVFAALIAVGSLIRIPLGLVPITLQTAFVFMAALTIGPVRAAISAAIYMLLGLIGLPIFAVNGGIFSPTFGFVLGFILCALVTGIMHKRLKQKVKPLVSALIAGSVGILCVYAIGLPYLYIIRVFYIGSPMAADVLLINYFLMFLPGDIIKMTAAALVADRLSKVKGLGL